MTSQLSGPRTAMDAIGDIVGRGIGQNLPGAMQQGYQRQTGLNSIDELQRNLAAAGGDIRKVLPALMRAQTLNPSLERSGLASEALKYAGAGNFAPALQQGANVGNNPETPGISSQPNSELINPITSETQQTQPPGMPPKSQGKNNAHDIDRIANQALGEIRPDLVNPETQYGNIATFDSEIKQDLTPDEEARLRQQLFDKYKNPDIVNPVIDRLREGIKNRYNEALSKYGFDKEKRQQIQDKWSDFTKNSEKRLEPHLSKYDESFPRTKEILGNKYNQYAASFPVNMTPEQMHTNAMALLQKDINKLDALATIPSAPPFRTEENISDYISNNKEAYKDLADQGFTEALREDAINNKDLGNEEFHSLIWGDQTSKPLLNEIHSHKAPQEYSKVGPSGAHVNKYNPQYPQQQKKYIDEIGKSLRKLKPKDDLLLARAMVLDNDGTIEDFGKGLQNAVENGLELSPFQKSQLQEINIPRVPPLWEFFREGSRSNLPIVGEVTWRNWGPFINYVRGKK